MQWRLAWYQSLSTRRTLLKGKDQPSLSLVHAKNFNSFDILSVLICENGGRIVGLDESKLTHIIVDKRDDSRRLELIKRTSKSVPSIIHSGML